MRRDLAFGLSMIGLVLLLVAVLTPWTRLENGHIGLLMLATIVVTVMLGFPTAFTLMGMGVIFAFIAYMRVDGRLAWHQTLDLMVQRAYAVMTNDVLIAIPLFVFMGYLVERAQLIERLFRSLHLAMARVPGALAVATIATCALFATATGIVGAVITLMGLLAMPAMLRAGYDVRVVAGAITAGGCLGILIPPSVLLILYGATAGVSVVRLYAGALLPGLMLAGVYIAYIVLLAKLRPDLMPPLPAAERQVPLSGSLRLVAGATPAPAGHRGRAFGALLAAAFGRYRGVSRAGAAGYVLMALAPGLCLAGLLVLSLATGGVEASVVAPSVNAAAPAVAQGAAADDLFGQMPSGLASPGAAADDSSVAGDAHGLLWVLSAAVALAAARFYRGLSAERLAVGRMLLTSFAPLALLIAAVLGSIAAGIATPTEAAATGALGAALLAAAYRRFNLRMLRESVHLTAKTTAMVCWLFVGSAIFSAAFALLGGQDLVEAWVLSLGLSSLQFLLLSQLLIFLLGWPLEWTEIIVIFMPIFVPLLDNYGIDPLYFGLLVALNLQTAYLSPPVAMSAFYLKGVAPPEVSLRQIFAGMLPFMGLQMLAMGLLLLFPAIGLWLPTLIYR
jgi:TRAP-type mannitol/chloroaromatic compound transport system permease large subunit